MSAKGTGGKAEQPGFFTKKRVVQLTISLVLAGVLIYFLVSQVSLGEAWKVLRNADPAWLLAGLLMYVATTWLKGLRWRLLIKNLGLRESFSMMSFSSMMINLLPFRLGEFGMPYLLRQQGVKLRNSLAFLVILRIFDFITIILIFFAGMLLVRESFPLPPAVFVVIAAVLLLLLVAVFALVFFHARLLLMLKKILPVRRKASLYGRFVQKAGLVSAELRNIKSFSLLFWMFLLSLIIWLGGILNLQVFLVSMGISFPFLKTMLAISFQVLLSNLPIQGLAGFGTYEGFWVLAFVLLGMDEHTAIISGLDSHILLLAMTIALGVLGWLMLARGKPKHL